MRRACCTPVRNSHRVGNRAIIGCLLALFVVIDAVAGLLLATAYYTLGPHAILVLMFLIFPLAPLMSLCVGASRAQCNAQVERACRSPPTRCCAPGMLAQLQQNASTFRIFAMLNVLSLVNAACLVIAGLALRDSVLVSTTALVQPFLCANVLCERA